MSFSPKKPFNSGNLEDGGIGMQAPAEDRSVYNAFRLLPTLSKDGWHGNQCLQPGLLDGRVQGDSPPIATWYRPGLGPDSLCLSQLPFGLRMMTNPSFLSIGNYMARFTLASLLQHMNMPTLIFPILLDF